MIDGLKKLSAVQLWCFSIVISVAMTELIVVGMEILLKGEVTYDYLLTGFVASLFVAGLVAGFLSFLITHLRKSDAALHESEEHFRSLFMKAPIPLALNSRAGVIESLNDKFVETFGYTLEDIQNPDACWPRAYPDEAYRAKITATCLEEADKALRNRNMVTPQEYRITCKDGTARTALISGSRIDDHILISLNDITERKQAEEALVVAKSEAELANRAKSEFLSSMSHELRTPLNAVLGFGQLLGTDATLNEQQRDDVSEIVKAGQHLLEMITELLDLSRIESGNLQLSIEPVACGELADMCLTLIRPLAEARDIRMEHDHIAEVVVRADGMRLKQVLINLLSNAIKYNRDNGHVRLHTASADGGAVRIMVTDTGFGIPSERLHELFQPFNRLGAEGGTIEGSGIGLTICKRLVELMGGRIGVESEAGTGSTFWVELPCATLEGTPSHAV